MYAKFHKNRMTFNFCRETFSGILNGICSAQMCEYIYSQICNNIVVSKQYKLKRCSNKEWCKQCRYVMFKGTMTKWPAQNTRDDTKTLTTPWRNRHSENIYFCVFRIFIFLFGPFVKYMPMCMQQHLYLL